MSRLGDKIKEYKELCMVTNEEICSIGGYGKTRQWVGQIINGTKNVSEETAREILNAISVARAVKMKQAEKETETDEQ